MSKVMNAVHQAEQGRDTAHAQQEPERGNGRKSGVVQSLKDELQAELRWMVARWLPAGVDGRAQAAPTWEQTLALIAQRLQRCEQQAADEAAAQARFGAQAAELEQQARRIDEERARAGEQREQSVRTVAALEAARAALSRQIAAAQAAQATGQEILAAAQEFHANAEAIARLAFAQPDGAGPIYYHQLADALQQQVAQFTSRLAKVTARA